MANVSLRVFEVGGGGLAGLGKSGGGLNRKFGGGSPPYDIQISIWLE